MNAWEVGFFVLLAAANVQWWATRHVRRRSEQVMTALMKERRRDARETAAMLTTIRPFLEDIARIDPEREESIQVGLLELDAHLGRAHKVAEGDTRFRRLLRDNPLDEEDEA